MSFIMDKFELYCKLLQVGCAKALGAPIVSGIVSCGSMIGWLQTQGVSVSILYGYDAWDKWSFDLDADRYIDFPKQTFDTRADAIYAAIDAALDFLVDIYGS